MIGTVVGTELLKLRRSKAPWVTLAVMLAGPLAVALFMWIVREPGRAARLGLLGAKADLSGIEATWSAFATFVVIVVGAAGMIVLAFVQAFLFGREYEEATAKNMLALPVARPWFAVAKLAVSALWWTVLVAAVLVEVGVIGAVMRLPGWSASLGGHLLGQAAAAAALAFLLCPLVAWVTVGTRSAVAAIGFALGMLMVGNVLSHTGWAGWFPWSIVFGVLGTTGPAAALSPAGAVVLVVTFAAGVAGTILQLQWADNAQ